MALSLSMSKAQFSEYLLDYYGIEGNTFAIEYRSVPQPPSTRAVPEGTLKLRFLEQHGIATRQPDGQYTVLSPFEYTPPDPSTLPPAIRAVAVAGPGAIGDELSAQPYPVVFAGDGTGGLHAWSNPDMHPDVERAHGDAAWGLIRTFRGHVGAVVGLSAAPDLQFLASGAWDGTVRIWDCRTGDSMHTIGGHTAFLGSVVVVGDSVISDGCNDVVVRHAFDESGAPL